MARVRTWPARTVEWEPGIASHNIFLLARQFARQGLSAEQIRERLDLFHEEESRRLGTRAVESAMRWAHRMGLLEELPGDNLINRAWMFENREIGSAYRYTAIFHWGTPGTEGFEARTVVVNSNRNLRLGQIREAAAAVYAQEAQRYPRFRGLDPLNADAFHVLNAERRSG